MTKGEFVLICTLSGYCDKKTAEKYVKYKEELTEEDFVKVHRKSEERRSRIEADKQKFHKYQGAKSTKAYFHGQNDKNGVGITEREGS